MKKIFLYALMLCALTLTGCGGDDDLRDSVGTSVRPTDWKAVQMSQLDITAPDRIVLTSKEVPAEIDLANDLMGAFVNDECRAVTSAVREENGQVHFTLVVMPKVDENTSAIDIELRYFSAKNKRIYIAEPFAFSAGTMKHGSLSDGGYQAQWK